MGGTGTGGGLESEVGTGRIVKMEGYDAQLKRFLSAREECHERGYHRINSEPKNSSDILICYDCELWFSDDFAKSVGLKYQFEPSM